MTTTPTGPPQSPDIQPAEPFTRRHRKGLIIAAVPAVLIAAVMAAGLTAPSVHAVPAPKAATSVPAIRGIQQIPPGVAAPVTPHP
jgi:hypothetical protein